jgi:hypothetical protein
MIELTQAPKNRRPAWFWLLIVFFGVMSVLFAALCLVVDDINGGPNEKNPLFWVFEGFVALVGLFLVVFGTLFLVRAESRSGSATFWSGVSCCGVFSVIFSLFCFLVYAANNGNIGFDPGGIIFWTYEGLFVTLGLFLIPLGRTKIRK